MRNEYFKEGRDIMKKKLLTIGAIVIGADLLLVLELPSILTVMGMHAH